VKNAVYLLQQFKRPSDHSTIVNSEVLGLITLNSNYISRIVVLIFNVSYLLGLSFTNHRFP
jgi:hypothetical protein